MDTYPPVGFHFSVRFELPGASDQDSRFQEVSGLMAEINLEELDEGGENRFTHRLPTRAKYPALVLKRGLVRSSVVIAWFSAAVQSLTIVPTLVNVALLNDREQPLVTWTFAKAWPCKLRTTDLNGLQSAIVVEELELAYQYSVRS